MKKTVTGFWSRGVCSLLGSALLLTLCGCDGMPINGVGTLTGTVTNSTTGSAMVGVSVQLEPALEDMEITTSDDGTFTQDLPAGVYTLTFEDNGFESASRTVVVFAGDITTLEIGLNPAQAAVLSTSVEGEAAPGGSVMATATVESLDGSAIESFSWTQTGGVNVNLQGATTDTASITLPDESEFKDALFVILAEPPIGEEQLPPNVPLPEGEFPGGLQNRFEVVGLNPFSLEEAGLVTLTLTVTTASGTFTEEVEIHTELPWKPTLGIHNVPVGVPVPLHGRDHVDEDGDGFNDETGASTSYNWNLNRPPGSSATLRDRTSQNPEFTPDVDGRYEVTVTDSTREPGDEVVTLEIYAGTWEGAITGQDENGRPQSSTCMVCHNDNIAPDIFTPWAQTGHAEIFTDNLNTSTHYGENCFACHTVGFDPEVNNGGIDEASDYQAFIDAGLLNNPGDNWTTVLNDFPMTAQLANIQCENCHGPQNGGAHTQGGPRVDFASDVCAACHGEPLRHARFQQWQLSGHANYELAIDEGESGNCSRCHTVNGFLTWLPVLMDDDPETDPLENIEVTWTRDETHPQTCVTCHDPHNIGTTTGIETNATVRISGNTPPLIAGFTVFGAGRGALCMTCHNSRRGLRNDDNFEEFVGTPEAARAPHGSSQTDVLMGQNAFFVEVGIRGNHSLVEDTCVNCHMEQTLPPDLLSYEFGGANHTFFASDDICAKCHGEAFDAKGVQNAFAASSEELQGLIESAMLQLLDDLTAAGNSINLNGETVISDSGNIEELIFGEFRGRQAITLMLTDRSMFGPFRMNDITVIDDTGSEAGELYEFADPALIKAGWNWNLVNNDGSRGVHNPSFVLEILDASIDELNTDI